MQLIGSAKKWIIGKEKQNIQQPTIIAAYNQGMRGVDLLDCALPNLRPVIHGKKWYWPLVLNDINLAFVYSWQLNHIVSGETILQNNFRQHIVGIMIRQSKTRAISVDYHPTKAHKVADEARYDGLGHYPISCSVRKCPVCGKSCRNSCEKCKRSLHVKTCVQIFHEK